MDITIHIGPHKTGTTAIQTAFARAASALKREGILYPKTTWRQTAHHRLAFALKGKKIPGGGTPDLNEELDAICHTISGFQGRHAFLSSEEFFSLGPEALTTLKTRLRAPIRIVTFLRRPDNFLISCYNQKIKQPGNGFAAPIKPFLDAPRKIAPEMDFAGAIATWADVFGDDAIVLETYEAGPPLVRLRALLGLKHLPPDPDHRMNVSVPGVAVEIMRHAKISGMEETHQSKLLARSRQVYQGYPPYVVSDADRMAVIAEMEPDLNALFERFGQDNPYTVSNFQPVPCDRDYNANMQDIMRLLDSFL